LRYEISEVVQADYDLHAVRKELKELKAMESRMKWDLARDTKRRLREEK
jgi:hypothetical protein